MAQTLLGEKLQRSGFIPREVRFSMAVAEFLNNGGTTERAHQLIPIVAADKMGSGGLAIFADKANNEMPPASQPNGDDGLIPRVEKAGLGLPSSPPNDSAAGHTSTADGQISSARPLSPHQARARSQPRVDHGHFAAREPSAADRAAMISVAKESAVAVLTVFDRYKVRDGRPLKKLRFHELMKLAQEDETESRAFRYMVAEVESTFANPDRMALVTELVSTEIAEKAFAFARIAGNA